MAAAPVGEAPVLAYIAIGILAFVAWVVCLGLRQVWLFTFGALFTALAHLLRKIPFVGGSIASPLEDLSNSVLNALEVAAAKSEQGIGYFFHGAAVIQGWVAREIFGLARDIYRWSDWLQHAHLPRWVKAMIYAAVPPFLLARLIHAAAHANIPSITRTITYKLGVSRKQVKAMIAAALAAAAIPAIPGLHLPRRLRDLENELAGLKNRFRHLDRYIGASAAVGIVVAALSRLGLKWLKCGNVSKVGKKVCGMDGSLLDELLTDALLIVGTISVVEFAKELLAIEGEAVKILGAGIREFPG